MKVTVLTIVILTMNLLTINNSMAAVEDTDIKVITRALPAEYADYEKQLTGNEVKDCNAAILLISKVKTALLSHKSDPNVSEKEEYNKAYYVTWRLCLRIMRDSKDPAVQKMILDEWNSSLREDDNAVPFQIYTLTDRSLLTDDFWELWHKTIKKKTISAISYELYQVGNVEDMNQLKRKLDSGIDVEFQDIIARAISHLRYKLSVNKTGPGPAAGPPTMNFKDDFLNREMIIPIRPIKTTASEAEKLAMDKYIDQLEAQLQENNPSIPHWRVIALLTNTVNVWDKPGWNRSRYAGSADVNKLDIPYGSDRVISILTSCLDSNDWQIRLDVISRLGYIGAIDPAKEDQVVSSLKTQLVKEETIEDKNVSVERRKEAIEISLQNLNRSIDPRAEEIKELYRRRSGGK